MKLTVWHLHTQSQKCILQYMKPDFSTLIPCFFWEQTDSEMFHDMECATSELIWQEQGKQYFDLHTSLPN